MWQMLRRPSRPSRHSPTLWAAVLLSRITPRLTGRLSSRSRAVSTSATSGSIRWHCRASHFRAWPRTSCLLWPTCLGAIQYRTVRTPTLMPCAVCGACCWSHLPTCLRALWRAWRTCTRTCLGHIAPFFLFWLDRTRVRYFRSAPLVPMCSRPIAQTIALMRTSCRSLRCRVVKRSRQITPPAAWSIACTPPMSRATSRSRWRLRFAMRWSRAPIA